MKMLLSAFSLGEMRAARAGDGRCSNFFLPQPRGPFHLFAHSYTISFYLAEPLHAAELVCRLRALGGMGKRGKRASDSCRRRRRRAADTARGQTPRAAQQLLAFLYTHTHTARDNTPLVCSHHSLGHRPRCPRQLEPNYSLPFQGNFMSPTTPSRARLFVQPCEAKYLDSRAHVSGGSVWEDRPRANGK